MVPMEDLQLVMMRLANVHVIPARITLVPNVTCAVLVGSFKAMAAAEVIQKSCFPFFILKKEVLFNFSWHRTF